MQVTNRPIYSVSSKNIVGRLPEVHKEAEKTVLTFGNYFYSLELATKFANCRKAYDPITALIIKITEEDYWEADWGDLNQRKYRAVYDYKHKQWSADYKFALRDLGTHYFSGTFVTKVVEVLNMHFPNGYPEEI